MEEIKELKAHLDHLTQEIDEMKKVLIKVKIKNKEKTERAWKDLMKASKEISKLWRGPSIVEEIREQRDKNW